MAVYTWHPVIAATPTSAAQVHMHYKGQQTYYFLAQGARQWYVIDFATRKPIGHGTQAQCKILAIRAHKASLLAR